jgi:lysozyme
MNISQNGVDFIKKHEGLRLSAYLDSVGVATIGYGNTYYTDGKSVKMGDKITRVQAETLLKMTLKEFVGHVNMLVTAPLNQNQFDALVSFTYNVGPDIDIDTIAEGLGDSTLLKKVNKNPDDPTIRDEFMKWNKGRVKGVLKPLAGLTKRRKEEADLYFS